MMQLKVLDVAGLNLVDNHYQHDMALYANFTSGSLEVIDMTRCDKGRRVSALRCPNLREFICTGNDPYGAGITDHSEASQATCTKPVAGNVFYKQYFGARETVTMDVHADCVVKFVGMGNDHPSVLQRGGGHRRFERADSRFAPDYDFD